MWWLPLLARSILGVFFLASGLAKVGAPGRTVAAARQLGVPAVITPIAGNLLAPVEIACGAALILTPTAGWAAVASVVLIAVFSAVVLANLLAGRRPSCGCFGSLSRDHIGWSTFWRNLGLLAVAAALAARSAAGAGSCRLGCYGAIGRRPRAVPEVGLAVESVVLVILIGLVIRLTLQAGRVQLRLMALESAVGQGRPPALGTHGVIGDRAWPLTGDAAAWLDRVAIGVLLFVAEGCAACDQVLAELGADDTLTDVPVLLVAAGSAHQGSSDYPLVSDWRGELRQSLAVRYTPTAILFDARQGEVRRAQGRPDVLALLRELTPERSLVKESAVDRDE